MADGMFVVAAMMPIGAGLHEPFLTCWPFVRGNCGTVAQKLMKLLEDVKEGTWPASALEWGSTWSGNGFMRRHICTPHLLILAIVLKTGRDHGGQEREG